MCNLYSNLTNAEAIRRLFGVGHNRAADFGPQSSVFPGNTAPVVRLAPDGERELVPMCWGFVLPQPGKAARRVTNIRDDRAMESVFWRESFEERRCLVPVTSFCEPNGQRPATWHWFGLDSGRPPFAFAGSWRIWRGRLRADGPFQEFETFAFLTTGPNEVVARANPERMPVMLADDASHRLWLNGSPTEALSLARPFPAERMRLVARGPDRMDSYTAVVQPALAATLFDMLPE